MVKRWAKAGGLMLAGTVLCILALGACAPQNPEQSPEQQLVNKCKTFYRAAKVLADKDIGYDTVIFLEAADATVDPVCSEGGPESLGITPSAALNVVEAHLEDVIEKQKEAGE